MGSDDRQPLRSLPPGGPGLLPLRLAPIAHQVVARAVRVQRRILLAPAVWLAGTCEVWCNRHLLQTCGTSIGMRTSADIAGWWSNWLKNS